MIVTKDVTTHKIIMNETSASATKSTEWATSLIFVLSLIMPAIMRYILHHISGQLGTVPICPHERNIKKGRLLWHPFKDKVLSVRLFVGRCSKENKTSCSNWREAFQFFIVIGRACLAMEQRIDWAIFCNDVKAVVPN